MKTWMVKSDADGETFLDSSRIESIVLKPGPMNGVGAQFIRMRTYSGVEYDIAFMTTEEAVAFIKKWGGTPTPIGIV